MRLLINGAVGKMGLHVIKAAQKADILTILLGLINMHIKSI